MTQVCEDQEAGIIRSQVKRCQLQLIVFVFVFQIEVLGDLLVFENLIIWEKNHFWLINSKAFLNQAADMYGGHKDE